MGGAPGMLMYTAPPRRAGVGALFRVHKNRAEPGPRPDLRSEMLVRRRRLPSCRRLPSPSPPHPVVPPPSVVPPPPIAVANQPPTPPYCPSCYSLLSACFPIPARARWQSHYPRSSLGHSGTLRRTPARSGLPPEHSGALRNTPARPGLPPGHSGALKSAGAGALRSHSDPRSDVKR